MRRFTILMVVASLLCGCDLAYGQDERITAIIGEAADQPFGGQIAIACGINNRPEGLQAVYGRYMTRNPSANELKSAQKALKWSEMPEMCRRLIQGADMWHSGDVAPASWLGVPMVFIVKISDHYFYRRLTKGEK